jgi:serine/threonine protein kinase
MLNLLSKMLQFNPMNRINVVDALQHNFFQEFGLAPSASECEYDPHAELTSTISDEVASSDNEIEQQDDTEKEPSPSPAEKKEAAIPQTELSD